MIKINGLTKKYKDCIAVNNLSLEIRDNELFALLGVNGAGKTTTIKMLSCITAPTEGDATVNGFSILKEQEEIKKIIGLSPQETSIARNLTVKENLMFYGGIFGLEKDELKKRVKEIIDKFKLNKYEKKYARNLSGGTMRKLSIGIALISKPEVLFLDEPTLGLDVISRHDLWDIIQELKKDTTIILTTHYLEEAEALADRIGIMSEGSLIEPGTSAELIEKAKASNFEQAFITLVKEKNA